MNQFCLNIIADKKIRRQLHLVERIYASQYPISLEEIANEFDISVRTLERDISEISTVDKDFIIQHKAVGYEIESHSLIDDLLSEISEQSPLFIIIQNIFEEIFLDVNEWADELFISSSALTRYLNGFKKILKDFDLTLSYYPIKIEGSEVNIRYFFFYFFYSTNDISEKYRPGQELFDIFEKNYNYFIENTHIEGYIQHRSLLYWIMVMNKRLEQGHHVVISEEIKEKQMQSLTYEYIAKLAHEIITTVRLSNITEDEIAFMDMLLLDNYIYKEGVAGPIEERLYPFLTKELHALVNDFFVDAKLEKPSDDTLYIFVFYIRNILLLSELTPLFQKNFFEVNQFVKSTHYALFKQWMDKVSSSSIPEFKNIHHMEDVCANLTLFTIYANSQTLQHTSHILFSFDGKTAYLNYLEVFVGNFIGGNKKMTFISNQHITNELAKQLHVDLVVTNYKETSQTFDCAYYNTARHPSLKDWDNIHHLILSM